MTDFCEPKDDKAGVYRALCVPALAGLILGLLSPLALAHPLLWGFPFVGVLMSGWALWKIHREQPVLAGRAAARWGLGLSLIFAAAAPTDWCVFRWQREDEARQFALLWFELLARQQPEKAFQLTMDPDARQPLDNRLWEYYRSAPRWRLKLEQYVAPTPEGEPPRLVRTLLALGDSACVRYLDTVGHHRRDGLYVVDQLYAITFDEGDGKKTFFAFLRLGRKTTPHGKASWQILEAEGGKKPEELT